MRGEDVRELTIEALGDVPVARRRTELVERKGLGHPDSLCDALVETASLALGRMYLERADRVLHYNLDKALLVAGECPKGFGWGELRRPMELIVGDRATFAVDGTTLPVADVVRGAVDAWIAAHLPHVRPGRDLVTRVVLAPGSEELVGIFHGGDRAAVSNDTSGASAWAPLSPTEELVLAIERFLNGASFKERFPDTGQDVKVFARRRDARVDVTVAMPMLCLATASERAYFQRKEEIVATLAERFRPAAFEAIAWRLNALDRAGRGTGGAYLSLTGTSAEDADSGQVGRGNRVNGIIALGRPSASEAAPGKNPVAHVGKIYGVLSQRLADLIHARCPELEEVYVYVATRIGDHIDQPWTSVQAVLRRGAGLADVEAAMAAVVEAELARLPALSAEIVRGEHPVS